MNIQQKKMFLLQYRASEREMERLQGEIAKWKSRAEKVTMGWDTVPGGGSGEGFPACVERIEELQERLRSHINESLALRRKISRTILSAQAPRERLLLQYRYIDGFTWERVAEKMKISERWAYNLHDKILSRILC